VPKRTHPLLQLSFPPPAPPPTPQLERQEAASGKDDRRSLAAAADEEEDEDEEKEVSGGSKRAFNKPIGAAGKLSDKCYTLSDIAEPPNMKRAFESSLSFALLKDQLDK
jgi:hypothetical protein